MPTSDSPSNPSPGELRLELPSWYRRTDLEAYWGRDPKSLQERVEAGRIRWALSSPWGPLGVEASWTEHGSGGPGETVLIRLSGEARDRVEWAESAVRRLFGLHLDPDAFEKALRGGPHGRLVDGKEGLTIPQTATPFDGAVWVICGQQVSLPVAFALRRRLAERFGRRLSDEEGDDSALFAPPRPRDLAGLREDELGALGFSRRKSEYLVGLARLIEDGFDFEALRTRPAGEVEERLLGIRGFGPWSVNYVMMRALGFEDQVPVGDAGLARALLRYFALDRRPDAEKTRELMRPFAPHRSLATFHFWASYAG